MLRTPSLQNPSTSIPSQTSTSTWLPSSMDMVRPSSTKSTSNRWLKSTSPTEGAQLLPPQISTCKMTPTSQSTTAYLTNPVISLWTNPKMDFRSSIYTGRHSAQDCLPSLPSFIVGCCYFHGRRQRQSRARHSELLHALSSSARYGNYPGSSTTTTTSLSQDAVGGPTYPVARYSAAVSSASCGLPGCATSYERPPFVPINHAGSSRYLPISQEAVPAVSFIDRASVPPRLRSHSSTVSRPLLSPLIAESSTVPVKQGSVPSTAEVSPSSSSASAGPIRPAHSVTDYNRRDFSRSAVPDSVYNLHVKY